MLVALGEICTCSLRARARAWLGIDVVGPFFLQNAAVRSISSAVAYRSQRRSQHDVNFGLLLVTHRMSDNCTARLTKGHRPPDADMDIDIAIG